ncbi:MAG: type II toxin-antitoxin system RelE/ParE family toxin [Gammaproteobacteria bacterium]|nr:type II toxin-antitoxin system RelE/ParE family toxin [Gammaproteobacteria bacterium]
MRFEVVLTEDAERDLEDIFTHIATHDSPQSAEHVLERILAIAESLSITPARGSQPKELRDLGDQDYRQVFFKPYRLIYRVVGNAVAVYLIADGRRDMQSLLARRLLGGS